MAHLALDHAGRFLYPLRVGRTQHQQLRRAADGREGIAQLVRKHRQEFVLAYAQAAQLVLGTLLVVDIGAGAHPARDAAKVVAHRQCPAQHPAIHAAVVAQAVLDFIYLAAGQAVVPGIPGARAVVGMEHIIPAGAVGRARRHAGIAVPLLVVVIVVAVRQGRPHHLRHGVGDDAKLRFALAQCRRAARSLGRDADARRHFLDQHQLFRRPVPFAPVVDEEHGDQCAIFHHRHIDKGGRIARTQHGRRRRRAGIVVDIGNRNETIALQVIDKGAIAAQLGHAGQGLDAGRAPVAHDSQGIVGLGDGAVADPAGAERLAQDGRRRMADLALALQVAQRLGKAGQHIAQGVLAGQIKVGQFLDRVHDPRHRAIGVRHRHVLDLPVAGLEIAAIFLRGDVVALQFHLVGAPAGAHAQQRGAQVGGAVGMRIVGIAGKGVEDIAAQNLGRAASGQPQISGIGGNDDHLWRHHHTGHGYGLQKRLESPETFLGGVTGKGRRHIHTTSGSSQA